VKILNAKSIILLSAGLLMVVFSAAALPLDVAGSSQQDDSCLPILLEVAQRAGIPGVIIEQYGNEGSFRDDDIFCYLEIMEERDGGIYSTELSITATPQENGVCATSGLNSTFHGYAANTDSFSMESERGTLELYTYGDWYINWMVDRGGICHLFRVNNRSEYPGWSEDVPPGGGTDFQMPDSDPLVYAEVLWSVAEEYLPLMGGISIHEDSPPSFFDGSEDGSNSDSSNGQNNIPALVVIGSIGVPIVGAVAGTILATILSSGGAAASGTTPGGKPKFGSRNEDGLVWSPRPWDQAGPGYVPKEEYLRTKDFLEKGYEWTSQGWKTPEEIREYKQWQHKNDAAVSEEDAAWREQWEQERRELEQKKESLQEQGMRLNFAGNLLDLQEDLALINTDLKNSNVYVANPYQGDPTLVFYGLNTLKNVVWDKTAGILTGDKGLTCEGFVENTKEKILEAVGKRFPGSTVQNVIFEEKSTVKPDKSVTEWFDSLVDDNHNLVKIILPDGSEWAVDFHQFNAGNSPLMRPWSEAQIDWGENYMGSEFKERIRRSTLVEPSKGK
jgi:hypothetical protein